MEEKINITINDVIEDDNMLEVFMGVLLRQIETDQEKLDGKARQFLRAYINGDCKGALMALSGWTIETLLNLTALKCLWDEFGDIPIKEDGEGEEVIDADFYHWPAGTDRYDIWHWFDEKCPNSLHDDLMFS